MALTRWMMPFWRVMRPTKSTNGRLGVHAVLHQDIHRRVFAVLLEINPVVDDVHLARGYGRETAQHVIAGLFETAMMASASSMAVCSIQLLR